MTEHKIAKTLAIGDRIHNRRKELGMTLELLSQVTGLSASFISQAERDKTIPSVPSLIAFAKALGVSVDYFMEAPASTNPIHRAATPNYVETGTAIQAMQVSREMEFNQKLNVMQLTVPVGEELTMEQREGECLIYILDGELYVELGDLKDILHKGDSIHFDSRIPHAASNQSGKLTQLLITRSSSTKK